MHERSQLHVAQRRWFPGRAVLQPRRQTGRHGERHPRCASRQRHRHHGGSSGSSLEDGRRGRRLRRRTRRAIGDAGLRQEQLDHPPIDE